MSDAKVITSLTNATVKLLASLRLEKFRQEHDLFLMEGVRTLTDAQHAGAIPHILAYREDVGSQANVRELANACAQAGGSVIAVSEEILCKITQKENPQTLIGAYPIQRRDIAEIDAQVGRVFIALDRIRDPGNLGTIIRTADAVGAAGVLLIGSCCDVYTPECTRASTGSIFHIPIFAGTEQRFLELVGTWPGLVIGTATTARIDYRQAPYQKPSLIVMGTEQSGLSDVIAKACRLMVRIPMHGRAESLNVAVASSLMLYAVHDGLANT